ncbi:Sec-independent protein translocase protein TatB [Erythrobacter sp. YT30]|uniref:Sec-independent protein translocase protein TatB n=1 Tax=Erythrobacter sp. YT30 TaxID=1735012 RepID=UPI00076C6EF7|nr:Sec-independent protein translocase protein TatB [Erythrobacter sp. YT30]KWV90386.1 preprotein translocase subunit TatB [Erythrobacter sp. YT30]
MFDLGAAEILVIIIVAVLVIGPKDMPLAMRTVGRWIGQIRRVSAHFRTGIDAMVREAELDDMEKKWKAQNEEIMKRTAVSAESKAGEPVMTGPPPVAPPVDPVAADDVPASPSADNQTVDDGDAANEPQQSAAKDAGGSK